MPLSDLPLDELVDFRPELHEPADFDRFWSQTIEEARAFPDASVLTEIDTPITELSILDFSFAGFGGETIKAWITKPKNHDGALATIVEFVGYGGGRGLPTERLQWAASGYVHVLMDTRGQGGGWGTGGDTPDPHGSGPASSGFMTRGVLDPAEYFYRRVFTDGVRLIDAVRTLDFVDPARVAVTGGSQGGGISLAVAGLVPDLVSVMPDVPFLCNFPRAVALTPGDPFTEITRFLAVNRDLADRVFETLSYFDGVNFARRITVPALFSVALMDTIVLPSTVFSAFNHLATTDKKIEVYPFNGHEGGVTYQWRIQADWLKRVLGS